MGPHNLAEEGIDLVAGSCSVGLPIVVPDAVASHRIEDRQRMVSQGIRQGFAQLEGCSWAESLQSLLEWAACPYPTVQKLAISC